MADQDNCRITVNTVGLEWFIYNRTPAYDVLAQTLGLNPDASPFSSTQEPSTVTVNMADDLPAESSEMQDKWFRMALPIKIVCDTGAIIMGNAHLPSLLVASFPSAHSMYSVTKARSSLDPYKTVLLVTFDTPSIDLRPNADYNTDITGRNMGSVPDISRLPPQKPSRISKLMKPLKDLWTRFFGVTRKETEEWHGLPRYSQNVTADQLKDSRFEEYAMVRNVLQCTALGLRYSTDTAGRVPAPSAYGSDADYDLPPEWKPPKPGELRVHAALQIMVTFSSSVTFKIPTKEKSKDWKYDDPDYQGVQGGKSTRPYGWLELKAQTGSTISVDIPMVYGPEGYRNVVLVDLQNVVVTSSVNYAPMIELKELKMVCQLHNPLIWNAQRNWDFELTLDTPQVFILRDHITLVQDLSRDWTAGPPVEMAYFVPFKYSFDLKLPNFQLYTYVNEHNIINEPTELDENAFIIASGQSLECSIVLPFIHYNPELTTIGFDVEILNGGLEIQLPTAHTLGEFLTPDSRKFATIPSVTIKGTYKYYDFVDSSHLESLDLDVKGDGVTIKLFGSVIRYVLILMDNYAGLYVNFVTMEEYRYQRDNPGKMEVQERKQANAKPPSDPYEVYVNFTTTDTTLILPENLYSCQNYSRITCSELQIELRNLDVYMDMHVNISPLTWSRDTTRDVTHRGQRTGRGNQNYLYIDGVTVYAHRLFGPLPKTTTYVANWKLDFGTIYGQIKPSFLLGVTSFAKAFTYNLVDGDNAFPPEYATVTPPDITIVDVSVKDIDVSVWGADVVSQILLKDGVVVHFDDVMNERYLSRVVLKLPSLIVRSMALTDTNREDQVNDPDRLDQDQWPWVELANLNCAFDITVYQGAANWRERRAKQQAFVKAQDSETRRCPYIYAERGEDEEPPHPNLRHNHFGTLYVPPLTFDPEALREGSRDLQSHSHRTSMVESMNDGGSIVELPSEDETPRQLHRHSFNRSNSSFSVLGGASEDEHSSEYGSQIDDWDDDLSNPDLECSSSDDDGLERSIMDDDSIHQEVVVEDEEEASSVHARSIPYSTYLKRYAIYQSRPGYQFSPYMPPPRVLFNQSKLRDILDDVPRHHPNANFENAFEEKLANAEGISSAHPRGEEGSQEKRTTVIVDATQDVKILLTPILLKIIQEFLEAINAEEWDLETMLDVTQMEYVELLTRMQPSKLHSQRFALNIPRIHLRFIQDIMMPDALNGGDDINMIKTRYELSDSDTNLCAVDIVLDDTAVIAAVKYEDEEFEKFVPGKIHIASFKVVESRASFDFSMFKLNARFVSGSTTRIFGIPDSRHQFSRLNISHLSFDNEPVIADITFQNFMMRLVRSSSPNHFLMQLDKLSVIFINQSAEIVAGAICSWLTFLKDLKTILQRFQLRRSKQLQTLFSEIANFSEQESINTDPVFLTKPSTTLRLGTLFYRNDDGWKLLAHIRHCMREMSHSRRNELQNLLKRSELEHYSTDDMYNTVISVFQKWRSWEIDDLHQCRLFSDVFEKKRMPRADMPSNVVSKEPWIYNVLRYSENSVQLRLGEFEGAIFDEQQDNSLNVTNLEFIFESKFKPDILAHEGLFPGMPISGDASRLSTGYLDVAVKTGFGNASVVVNPVVIAFVKHILRVERTFRPQFNKVLDTGPLTAASQDKKMAGDVRFYTEGVSSPRHSIQFSRDIPPPATSSTSIAESETNIQKVLDRFDIVFNGMAVIETILITMHAQNLTAKVIFSQIQASALNFAQQRSLPHYDPESISVARSSGSNTENTGQRSGSNRLIGSIVSNISSINSTLLERVYAKEGSVNVQQERELLTFGIVGLNSDVTLSLFTPPRKANKAKGSLPREVINVLITFKQVGITLPRSILKLYLFAKDWREENMKSFDFLFQGVMDEWEADRKSRPQPKVVLPSVPRELKVQMILKTFTLESHMLPSLLFQYEAGDLMVMLHDIPPGLAGSTPRLTYNIQLLRQSVDFLANQKGKGGTDRHHLLEDKHAASFTLPVIRASGSVMNIMDAAAASRTRRSSITVLARNSRMPKKLDMSVSLDFVELTLNVSMLDNLLTAQSLLGAEINELIDMLSKTSKPAATPTSIPPSPSGPPRPSSKPELLYFVKVSLVGLSIAAVSPSAILYFESDLLKGVITNNPDAGPSDSLRNAAHSRLAWRVHAQSVTLSLNHHLGQVRTASRTEDFKARKLRLAYITINLNVQNFSPDRSEKDRFAPSNVSPYYVSFLKIHALMQPQSVSRMIGLYTYYVHELDRRKEMKAAEMARLADNTKRIMKSLDVEVPTAYKDNTRSMLEAIEIYLTIDDVAVAIPLDRREDVMSSSERLVEAFLISATSISVLTKSGEKSSGTLNNLCAQFVQRFDQSKDEHFRSRHHAKINRLTFPSISCKVDAYKESSSVQHISSEAFVSGFELDIDPSIVRYITTLSDVYDHSKVLVTSVSLEGTGGGTAAAAPTSSVTSSSISSGGASGSGLISSTGTAKSTSFLDPSSAQNQASSATTPNTEIPAASLHPTSVVVIWKVENTFQCSKSVCRFYPKGYATSRVAKPSGFTSKTTADASGVDRFFIPGLSLWTSLMVPVSDSVADLQAAGPARLHAEINVHSSENTFYPSLVPFFHDIVSGLKEGIRRPRAYSNPKLLEDSLKPPLMNPTSESRNQGTTENLDVPPPISQSNSSASLVSVGKKQDLAVTVYLFLEKTRIEFNCQPTAKVMSVLTFEQGNILTSYNSDRAGNTTSTLAGTFQGASSETRHIFSQDKGFKLETKAVTFNAVAETRAHAAPENNKKTLSVFVDFIQFGMDFDLRQSEILVLMKMIWMDQANYLIKDSMTVSRSGLSQQAGSAELQGHSPSHIPRGANRSNDSSEASLFRGSTPSQPYAPSPSGSNNSNQVVAMRESSFLGYNVFAIAQLQQMKITGDLGSQIGKMEFSLDQVSLRIKLRPFHPRSLSFSTGALNLQFLPMDRGWLEGYLTMDGVHLESVAKVTRVPSFPCNICEVQLVTKKLSSMLSYDYKKILVLEVDPFRVVVQDHWNGPDMERDLSLAILAHLQGLRLLAGAKTVPVFKTVFTRLVALLEQKQSAALEELKNPLLSPSSLHSGTRVMLPTGSLHNSSADVGIEGNNDSSLGKTMESRRPMWNAIGRVQLSVQELDLSFFPFLLSDKECTHASVNTVKVGFDRYVIYADGHHDEVLPVIHRLTTVSIGGLSLQKYTLPVFQDSNQVHLFTVQQWFERTRTHNAQTIAKLPATSQMMESWQQLNSHVIEHICKTQFAGLIDIATDYRLFRGVEKNVERFMEEMSIRDHRSADETAAATSAAAAAKAIDVVAVAAAAGGSSGNGNGNGSSSVTPPMLSDLSVIQQQDSPTPLSIGSQTSLGEIGSASQDKPSLAATSGQKQKDSPASGTTAGTISSADEATGLTSSSLRKGLLVAGLGNSDERGSPDNKGVPSEDEGNGKDAKSKISGTATPTTATAAPVASTSSEGSKKGKEKSLTFQARDSIVFKPALDVLPNTPLPLGQLGFKKEDIPPIVHTLTSALEDGLLAAADFHQDKVRVMGLHDLWEGRVKMDD
ncbi:hypothetical protein BGW42_007237 [Actinomortierella wolfii]|nr:hypothetical protein BGW42_007237 [Actinomortierella wolfii]